MVYEGKYVLKNWELSWPAKRTMDILTEWHMQSMYEKVVQVSHFFENTHPFVAIIGLNTLEK